MDVRKRQRDAKYFHRPTHVTPQQACSCCAPMTRPCSIPLPPGNTQRSLLQSRFLVDNAFEMVDTFREVKNAFQVFSQFTQRNGAATRFHISLIPP